MLTLDEISPGALTASAAVVTVVCFGNTFSTRPSVHLGIAVGAAVLNHDAQVVGVGR
jgi:hypothetical protein